MISRTKLKRYAVFLIYLFIGLVLIGQFNSAFTSTELLLYSELIFAYFWTAGLLVYAVFQLNLYLFEPMVFIGLFYEMMFVIKPCVDLHDRYMVEHTVNVLSGGNKATALFVLGFTVFFFAYYCMPGTRRKIPKKPYRTILFEDHPILLYSAWTVLFVLCIYSFMSKGLSLNYIFSLGRMGHRITDGDGIDLLFLDNFGITLITCWLIIILKTKSRMMKIIISVLTILYLIVRNARWLVLIFLLSPIVYYYTKKHRMPNMVLLLTVGTLGIVVFAWMQANRTVFLTGGAISGWGNKGFSLSTILAPFDTELNIYRTFYSLVNRYPSIYPYIYGQSFLYTFILFIPRILWKAKPKNPFLDIIENALNVSARTAGTSLANIGEFYANFGIIGVVVGMFLLGRVMRWVRDYFVFNSYAQTEAELLNRDDNYILYGILFPLLFSWIARGYFCSNFYTTIFALLPFIVKFILERARRVRLS